MDSFRIANLIMQGVYLPVHIIFIIMLLRKRQSSPVWNWFIPVVVGLLMLITGRLTESVLYLFYPSNTIYTVAVYFQLIGTTMATVSYLFWNLYLAGKDVLADSKVFRGIYAVLTVICCGIVCTSHICRLFYEKLVMGEQVVHGTLFVPCVVFIYGSLFAGYIVSIIYIVRSGEKKLLRFIVFSMYPLLPALTNLARSISGVDRIDTNPIVMTVSIFCLYLIVFKESFVSIIPETMESVLNQTGTPLLIFNGEEQQIIYENEAARRDYAGAIEEMLPLLQKGTLPESGTFGGKVLRLTMADLPDGNSLLQIGDMTDLISQQRFLSEQIKEQHQILENLEEQKRNVTAYLEMLYEIPQLKEKQTMISDAEVQIKETLRRMEDNLSRALDEPANAEEFLSDNLKLAETTITVVRQAVTRLREA